MKKTLTLTSLLALAAAFAGLTPANAANAAAATDTSPPTAKQAKTNNAKAATAAAKTATAVEKTEEEKEAETRAEEYAKYINNPIVGFYKDPKPEREGRDIVFLPNGYIIGTDKLHEWSKMDTPGFYTIKGKNGLSDQDFFACLDEKQNLSVLITGWRSIPEEVFHMLRKGHSLEDFAKIKRVYIEKYERRITAVEASKTAGKTAASKTKSKCDAACADPVIGLWGSADSEDNYNKAFLADGRVIGYGVYSAWQATFIPGVYKIKKATDEERGTEWEDMQTPYDKTAYYYLATLSKEGKLEVAENLFSDEAVETALELLKKGHALKEVLKLAPVYSHTSVLNSFVKKVPPSAPPKK